MIKEKRIWEPWKRKTRFQQLMTEYTYQIKNGKAHRAVEQEMLDNMRKK